METESKIDTQMFRKSETQRQRYMNKDGQKDEFIQTFIYINGQKDGDRETEINENRLSERLTYMDKDRHKDTQKDRVHRQSQIQR